MATDTLVIIYTGGGFSVATTNILRLPAVDGTITGVYLDATTDSVGDALFSLKLDGAEIVGSADLFIADGTQNVNVTGLSIAMTKGSLLTLDLVAPVPATMPEPPYSLIITYDDGTTIDVAGAIHAATGKTTPVDADELGIVDSAASNVLKKLTWANLKATAKTYFDSLYQPVDSDLTTIAGLTATTDSFLQAKSSAWAARTIAQVKTDLNLSGTNTGDQTSVTGNAGTATALQTGRTIDGQTFDGTANITVIAPGTHAATSKATPVDADELPIVDSAASNVLKKLTWANLKATLKTYFDTLYQAVLVSGTNIKTINSTSLLGSGDIAISGSVATDAIFDAKGDLAVGTGADTAAKLTVGSNGTFLKANSAQSTGLEWAAVPGGGDLLASNNLSDVANAGTARTNLGVAIGSNVQAWDADLDALAALAGTNTIYYRSAANTWTAVTIGTNLTFSGGTLSASGGGGGITYTEVTGTSQSAAVNNGYITNNASLVTVTLPSTAAVGDIVVVTGSGAGGWKIAQNASQEVKWTAGGVDASNETTAGTGGYLASTDRYDSVELQCITANNVWTVLRAKGVITLA